jgi:hypothetical protein
MTRCFFKGFSSLVYGSSLFASRPLKRRLRLEAPQCAAGRTTLNGQMTGKRTKPAEKRKSSKAMPGYQQVLKA